MHASLNGNEHTVIAIVASRVCEYGITQRNSRGIAHVLATLLSLLLYEPYANKSSQMCPFLAVRQQFESVHHQKRRLSSHSYSHASVIFRIVGINIFKVTASLRFLSLTARGYDRGQQVAHRGRPHAESIIFNRGAASLCGLSRVGYFIPLNGRRPLYGHPPCTQYNVRWYGWWR